MNAAELNKLRREYVQNKLNKSTVDKSPFVQFEKWFREAIKSEIKDVNAMALATAGKDCKPSVRTVLLKENSELGFVFFTNYESRKAKEIELNNNASLLFYWKELDRQIRIEGTIQKISKEESEEYFHTRPRESQIAAWISHQSEEIPNREYLEEKFEEYKQKFGEDVIPLPDFWGGYRLIPDYFEFWQGRENRLHDRICYKKENDEWKIFRLAP